MLPPDWAELLGDFYRLRGVTQPGFAGPGRITLPDMRAMWEMGFWKSAGMPFADYFDVMATLDKTLCKWYAEHEPPEKPQK
jgi:hypothetical protein